MKTLLAILRFFLSLRYSVKVTGAELLQTPGAKLILPNHQAHVDPQIAYTQMYKHTVVLPVVAERFYNSSVLNPLFKKLGAVPVSDLEAGNRDKQVLETIFSSVTNALAQGKNILLYPSGQIAGQGYEKIFNKQSAYQIVLNLPENTQVIGLRINGLWGSMWSKAWIGKSPSFFPTLLKAIFYLFANAFIFLPKRKVTLEFVDITKSAQIKAQENRLAFNNFLEKFYNIDGEEEVTYIKHFFYAPKLNRHIPSNIEGSINDAKRAVTIDESNIPVEIFNKVLEILIKESELKDVAIDKNKNLSLDLGIDSLALVAIIESIEQSFNNVIPPDITVIKTVADLCYLAMGKGIVKEVYKDSFLSEHIAPKTRVKIDPNKNIVELFLKEFKGNKAEPFAYDKIIGTTTRKDFLLKAMVVSKIIQKEVPEQQVGIMLPALQSSALLVMATYLAGKVPVMLNWTVGPKVLSHCVNSTSIQHILTAGSFFEKIEELLPQDVKDKCIFFEKKVATTGLSTKLAGVLKFYITPKYKIKPDDTAVILFTSGSESLPKAVKLTHKNLVSNLSGVCEDIYLHSHYILLSFLPPFHSFGFTVLTIFPLITGLKIAYTPSPTDTREVLNIMRHTSTSMLLATPTFLKMLLSISDADDFKNIELAVTGAESLHPSIIETFKSKANAKAIILEGYGITECSPVISINPLEKQKLKSVGKCIAGVSQLIVDIETEIPLETNKEGMILVKGPNVFGGYTDSKIPPPFVTVNNEQYYKTGDLGYVDDEGYIFITGRLKRFIKIAGEMISLPAIENTLLEKYGAADQLTIAVEGNDAIEPPQIVLFSIIPLDIQEVNAHLRSQGFSSLVKIHNIQQVQEIPLLGTGKTDYKVLKNMIN